MTLLKKKFTAFCIHLLISVIVILIFYWYVTHYWYPGSLFKLEKTWEALNILIPVDAILGPILTFVLFVPKKKHLKVDLSLVAFFQIAALMFGATVIHSQRPVIITFDVKEFQIILASEIIRENLPRQYFPQKSQENIRMVYALPPQNEKEVAHYFLNAISYQKEPARFRPVKDNMKVIMNAAIPLKSMSSNKIDNHEQLELIEKYSNSSKNTYLFPLKGSLGNYTYVLVDLTKNKIIDFVDLTLTNSNKHSD